MLSVLKDMNRDRSLFSGPRSGKSDTARATMSLPQLREEFQTQHMRATAIELSNRQNTGWTQAKAASELLDITYPTDDVRRALDAVAATSAGKPIVMMGQRGSGKSHIMALIMHSVRQIKLRLGQAHGEISCRQLNSAM